MDLGLTAERLYDEPPALRGQETPVAMDRSAVLDTSRPVWSPADRSPYPWKPGRARGTAMALADSSEAGVARGAQRCSKRPEMTVGELGSGLLGYCHMLDEVAQGVRMAVLVERTSALSAIRGGWTQEEGEFLVVNGRLM